MDINTLKNCLRLVAEDKFLYSPYYGKNSWSPEGSLYLQSEPESILFFIRDKIARLIQYTCNGLKDCNLDSDCIVMDVPCKDLMEQLITHTEQVLATSSIGGVMAGSFTGGDCPEIDNFAEYLYDRFALYMYNLSNLMYDMGHEFFTSCKDLLDVLVEEESILIRINETENAKSLASLLTDDELEQLYGLYMETSTDGICSLDTFQLLARETGYLFNTLYNPLQYHYEDGEFCVYVLHDYLFVMTYCNNHHDRLTRKESLLWDIVQAFERKGLANIYMVDYEEDSVILSDGSKACYQSFQEYSAPYTGENIYFGLYVSSFTALARLLKKKHADVEGGYVP